ncbi:MAG: RNase adapter RapZ [Thermotogota bacterium]
MHNEKTRNLVILSGLSGSGKTTCLGLLEDIGFFCVDNIPPQLLKDMMSLFEHMDVQKMALVVDARWKQRLDIAKETILQYREMHPEVDIRIIFLEAQEAHIAKRYALTRRKHPLTDGGSLAEAYRKEIDFLAPIKEIADNVIDTSNWNTHELREALKSIVVWSFESRGRITALRLISFGYKHGMPLGADFVVDTRFLPNPYYRPELAHLDGLDPLLGDFFSKFPIVSDFIQTVISMLEIGLHRYEEEGRDSVTVAIGCSGGRHRSVFLTERIREFFSAEGFSVYVEHRDIRL